MIHFLISIIGILITIFFVIGTHEYAHFTVARLLGIKVLRFSIGFGKTLLKWYDKKGTEYVIALIPLGGYVKMLDASEGTVSQDELHLAFNTQPYYKKFLVVLAGPLINILCALILYWMIFMIGFTTIKPIIGSVTADSIAANGGLEANQEIIKVDDYHTSTWAGFILRLIAHAGNQDQIKIEVRNSAGTDTHLLDLSHWRLDGLVPDPLTSIGITPYAPTVPLIIGNIAANSPASSGELHLNDKVISINHQPVKNWDELITMITQHPDETVTFTIERQNKIITLPITIGYQRNLFFQKSGYLGVGPKFTWPKELLNEVKYGPIEALPHAWRQLYDFTYFNFLLIGKLVTGKLSLQSLGGPITIFDTAGDALNYGFLSFISFLAFLSISIGVINLLPIPGLDGGHLFIQTIEFILRQPVPEQVTSILYRLGFTLILFILVIALVNDLLRL
ncbi:MAG: RIP metalloprotease RseP [Gammaproteobacteria bacterium]|nr:RIP metalloprotease RseP [Gammaproteobacteria bacterium]MCW5582906.1 RIP metalloprotease RseP [Gammaproteobacteria bacterium]